MSSVPYEKGALFLSRLESLFGRERFDAFLKGYFDHFAFQSITTADFETYLRETLFPEDPKAAEPIDLHAWLRQPGLPADAPEPTSERFAAVEAEARRWLDGQVEARDLTTDDWSTLEWLRFLRTLPRDLPASRMAELDAAFGLTDRGNSEIIAQWLEMAIHTRYPPAGPRLEQFLTRVGRRKFLMPLYEALARTAEGKSQARAIYKQARRAYHPIAAESVDQLLGRP